MPEEFNAIKMTGIDIKGTFTKTPEEIVIKLSDSIPPQWKIYFEEQRSVRMTQYIKIIQINDDRLHVSSIASDYFKTNTLPSLNCCIDLTNKFYRQYLTTDEGKAELEKTEKLRNERKKLNDELFS